LLRPLNHPDLIRDSVHRVAQAATVRALTADRSAAALFRLIRESLAYQSDFTSTLERQGRVDCREGCVWCCYLMVHVTAPEALLIAQYIRDVVPSGTAAILGRRLAHSARRARYHGQAGYAKARIQCGLLLKDRCAVYPVRPVNCRACVSPDRSLCRDEFDKRSQGVTAPSSRQHRSYAAGLKSGLLSGLKAIGIDAQKASKLELNNAVMIALQTENAAEEWLSGRLSFESAYGL